MFINSRNNSSSSFLTNRPFTRRRESAKFLRTSYLTRFVHILFLRYAINLAMRARRDAGEYAPTRTVPSSFVVDWLTPMVKFPLTPPPPRDSPPPVLPIPLLVAPPYVLDTFDVVLLELFPYPPLLPGMDMGALRPFPDTEPAFFFDRSSFAEYFFLSSWPFFALVFEVYGDRPDFFFVAGALGALGAFGAFFFFW